MKRSLLFSLGLGAALSVGAQSPLETAQSEIEKPDPASVFADDLEQLPPLFEDETRDLGPQYLLLPGEPAHDWFSAIVDLQWLNTTNPTQDEDAASRSADLRILTGQFGLRTPEQTLFEGTWETLSGIRYQRFDYGNLSGDVEINGVPVSESDFEAVTLFTNLSWTRQNWSLRLGLRWTELENDQQGSGFYRETVPNWGLSRDFLLDANSRLRFSYEGAYFFSENESFVTVRDDLNDRFSNTASVSLLRRFNSKLYVEPSVRLNHSDYTNDPNGGREDLTLAVRASVYYYFSERVSLRLFTSYQKRHSDGLAVPDYTNWDLGLGGTLAIQF